MSQIQAAMELKINLTSTKQTSCSGCWLLILKSMPFERNDVYIWTGNDNPKCAWRGQLKRACSTAANVCTSKRSSPPGLENIASEENAAFLWCDRSEEQMKIHKHVHMNTRTRAHMNRPSASLWAVWQKSQAVRLCLPPSCYLEDHFLPRSGFECFIPPPRQPSAMLPHFCFLGFPQDSKGSSVFAFPWAGAASKAHCLTESRLLICGHIGCLHYQFWLINSLVVGGKPAGWQWWW